MSSLGQTMKGLQPDQYSVKITGDMSSELAKESQKEFFGLKLWQIGALIGVPTALVLFYLMYSKKSNEKLDKKSTTIIDDKKPIEAKIDEKKIADMGPLEKAVGIKNLGNEFFQNGNFSDAVKCYTEAIKLCPPTDKQELPKFFQNRAAAFENLKMYDDVVQDCTFALDIDPNYAKALTRRAKALESLEKYQEAFEDFTALCILNKFSGPSMAAADKIVKKIGERMGAEIFKTRPSIPISQHFVSNFYIGLNNDIIYKNTAFYEKVKEVESSRIKEAIEYFNKGEYEECIVTCTKEIEAENEYALEARNLRGSLYMLKCEYALATEDFYYILEHENCSDRIKSNTCIKLTALNLQRGDEQKAFDNYDRAIEYDPLNEDIYCNRAQVYAMKSRFDECFADFKKCIELNPDHKIAKLQKAFFEFRQFYAQFSMYIQATNQTGDNANSIIHSSQELKDETMKLENLLNTYSEIPEAYNLYAQILSEQENYEKAEKYYRIALEKDPDNAALLVQRALNIMTWKNEFDEPIIMLNEAIKIDDTCEFAYETLATIEIQRGQLTRAVELFEKAIQLTRSEDSMNNLCCMLVGAKTQFKILQQYSGAPQNVYV